MCRAVRRRRRHCCMACCSCRRRSDGQGRSNGDATARAGLWLRSPGQGIPVIVLVGSANGCFGGMGIVASCADQVVMSDIGRHAMSGPEVIESSHGVDEFDSRDRALVWRTTGGKHRWLCGDCDALVDDDPAAFRQAAIEVLDHCKPVTLEALEAEHGLLVSRLALLDEPVPPGADDATTLWLRLGIAQAGKVGELEVDEEVCTMQWQQLAVSLFGPDHGLHGISQDGDFLQGTVVFDG
eukprot:gene57077-78212_t